MTDKPNSTRAAWACLAGLVLLTVFVATYRLGQDVALDEHESLIAETAREMVQGGEWLIPHFADQVRVRKTPLPYWVLAGLSGLTGQMNEWSVRLPSALAAVGMVLCICWLGGELFGRRAGLICGYVAVSSVGMFVYSHEGSADMQLTFWCTLCFVLFWKGLTAAHARRRALCFYGFYVAFAVAMLAKGPMPLPAVALPLLVFVVATRQWGVLRRMHLIGGVMVVAGLLLPWVAYVALTVPDVADLWRGQFLDRFTGQMGTSYEGRWYQYLALLFVFTVPWSLWVPQALGSVAFASHQGRRRAILYLWLWLVVNVVFLSVSHIRRAHYLLPAFPALALLVGMVIERPFFESLRGDGRWVKAGVITVLGCMVLGAVGGGVFVQREWPGLFVDYLIAGLMGTGGVVAAGVAFLCRRRGLSFAVITVTSVVLFCWVRPAVGPVLDSRAEVMGLVQAINSSVPPNAELKWVGRQDAPVVFYGGRKIPRFDQPMPEVPEGFPGPRTGDGYVDAVVAAVNWRFSQQTPIYLIADAKVFRRFEHLMQPPGRVVVCYPSQGKADKQTVIFTNVPPAATQPTGRPEGMPRASTGRASSGG